MIKISVDEAYAFDMLSILLIKNGALQTIESEAIANKMIDELKARLRDSFSNVMASVEFSNLYAANLKVFNLINLIKTRPEQPGDASVIDRGNYERYLAKKALQEKFYPNETLSEKKIGY